MPDVIDIVENANRLTKEMREIQDIIKSLEFSTDYRSLAIKAYYKEKLRRLK